MLFVGKKLLIKGLFVVSGLLFFLVVNWYGGKLGIFVWKIGYKFIECGFFGLGNSSVLKILLFRVVFVIVLEFLSGNSLFCLLLKLKLLSEFC